MKTLKIILLLLLSNLLFSQNNMELNIKSDHYINDSIWFGVAQARGGFEDLYGFTLETNSRIKAIGKSMGFPLPIFSLNIQKDNKLVGEINYPQPVAFLSMKERTVSNFFFIEQGKYEINLPKIDYNVDVVIKSPTNIEYKNLKQFLKPVYVKGNNPYGIDSLTDFGKKQEMISVYIKENPNSYVALWEIIDDYTLYNYSSTYLDNMKLFSSAFKQNQLYKKLEHKLIAESKTLVGNKMPTINFSENEYLTEEDFKKYKLTFIDFWSTTCPPCIKSMPDIVKLYDEYRHKGVNFISITDESKPDRIELANTILKKNNAIWINYFDTNKDFSKKVNATSYPIQFIVDSNGIIIARIYGDLDEVRKVFKDNLL